ncbi:hypothetical protein ABK040_009602 [Willaertia magna]
MDNNSHKWILLGIISQDLKTQHYQFHSVNNLNNCDNQMNNHSTITHYLYFVATWYVAEYTPYCRVELQFLDKKTNILHNLQDDSNQKFMYCDYSDNFASVSQSVSLSNNYDISTLKNINLENLQPLNEYQLLDVIYWIKLYGYNGTRIILNFKNILLSKVVKLENDEDYNHLHGNNFWDSRKTNLSLGNMYYLKPLKNENNENNINNNEESIVNNENNGMNVWVPRLLFSPKSIVLFCINDGKQNELQFSNINDLNIDYSSYNDKYISLIKSGNNNNVQYILHFINNSGIYKLFYFDTNKLRIFEKKVRNMKLLQDLEIIDNCPLDDNLHLIAMKREDLSKINRVITIEEYLLHKYILFFILDLNSFTIKEISPIIYPLALSKQLITNISNRKELKKDGFQIVAPKRKYRSNIESNSEYCSKIYINNRVDINGGITNDVLCRSYLLRKSYSFNNKNLSFRSGVKIDDFSMTCFREFNETNKDIFNLTLAFNQRLKIRQTCEPFFITLYFKVKDCCSGVVWYNNQLLSDVSINFR